MGLALTLISFAPFPSPPPPSFYTGGDAPAVERAAAAGAPDADRGPRHRPAVPALLHLPDGRAHTVATHQTLIHHGYKSICVSIYNRTKASNNKAPIVGQQLDMNSIRLFTYVFLHPSARHGASDGWTRLKPVRIPGLYCMCPPCAATRTSWRWCGRMNGRPQGASPTSSGTLPSLTRPPALHHSLLPCPSSSFDNVSPSFPSSPLQESRCLDRPLPGRSAVRAPLPLP